MPSIPLHPPSTSSTTATSNPLPQLLQTPSGLAILELQGTLHFPSDSSNADDGPSSKRAKLDRPRLTEVGKLLFPLHDAANPDDKSWMKRVYLYVGRNQRMTGEVKPLAKPLAVIRRRNTEAVVEKGAGETEELEIVEVVKYKIVFASRPEPVGTMEGVEEGAG